MNKKANEQKIRSQAINRSLYSDLFPPKMSKGDLRKLAILESAVKTYSSVDVDYVSFEDIARSAKISRPLVQHHFPEKLDLFMATVKFVRANMQLLAVEYLNKSPTPQAQLEAYIRSTFIWASSNPLYWKTWVFFYYQCMNHPELKAFHTGMTEIGRDRIVALLESGEEAGVFAKADFLKRAFQIQQIITGGLIELSADNGRTLEAITEDSVELCLKILR